MNHTTLVVKATRLCNLRCDYCHDWRTGPNQTMSFDVMARMISNVLHDPLYSDITFIWHGGEATILPISFYQKAVLVQAELKKEGQTVKNTIQTNATRLNAEWLQFFKSYDFSVGISLDGPPYLHNRHRKHVTGKSSFEDVVEGMRLLRQYRVPFSVLMVIDKEALAEGADKIFECCMEYEIKHYGLIAVTPANSPQEKRNLMVDHYVDPNSFNSFLMRLFDRWVQHGDSDIKIREIDNIVRAILHEPSGSCKLAGNCFGHYFIVEPNGDVAHCDLFLGDPRYQLGNVLNDTFSKIRSSTQLRELANSDQNHRQAMSECPEFNVCHGWCPHERYLSIRHNKHHSSDCCGLKELIEHIRANLPLNWARPTSRIRPKNLPMFHTRSLEYSANRELKS